MTSRDRFLEQDAPRTTAIERVDVLRGLRVAKVGFAVVAVVGLVRFGITGEASGNLACALGCSIASKHAGIIGRIVDTSHV